MSSSCSALLGALKACLLESDCVRKHERLPSECLKHHTAELPEACQNLRRATYDCKRNMLDMRKRFRGNTVGMDGERIKDQWQLAEKTLTEDISKHPGHMTDTASRL